MRWPGHPSGWRETRLWLPGEGAERRGVWATLGKSVHQSLLGLHELATDKNGPHLCDFTETHCLEEVRSIQELGEHVTPAETEHTWGTGGELSLRLASHSHGGDIPVTKVARTCRSHLYFSYNLHQIIHLCFSFVPFLQIR